MFPHNKYLPNIFFPPKCLQSSIRKRPILHKILLNHRLQYHIHDHQALHKINEPRRFQSLRNYKIGVGGNWSYLLPFKAEQFRVFGWTDEDSRFYWGRWGEFYGIGHVLEFSSYGWLGKEDSRIEVGLLLFVVLPMIDFKKLSQFMNRNS